MTATPAAVASRLLADPKPTAPYCIGAAHGVGVVAVPRSEAARILWRSRRSYRWTRIGPRMTRIEPTRFWIPFTFTVLRAA